MQVFDTDVTIQYLHVGMMSLCVGIIFNIPTNKSVDMLAVCTQKYLHIPTARFTDAVRLPARPPGRSCRPPHPHYTGVLHRLASSLTSSAAATLPAAAMVVKQSNH